MKNLKIDMSKITVVNIKDKQEPNTYRKYCGRSGKGQVSYLGNPFIINKNQDRDKVCDLFQEWLDRTIECKGEYNNYIQQDWEGLDKTCSQKALWSELQDLLKIVKEGKDLELACFCKPLRCHCDSIKNYLDNQLNIIKPFKLLVTTSKHFNDYERLEKDILSIVQTRDIKNLKLITDNELAIKFYQNYKEVELEKFYIENINDITNHSGGALGADSMFDTIGREYGFNNHTHYYHGNKTPLGNMKLSTEEILEGIEQAKKASKILGKSWNNKYASLLGRNWFQVKNSDIIIAIASLIHPNEEGVRGYVNKTNKTVVSGGTSYACEMAILHNKPVFVYDLKTKCWYRCEDGKYIKCDVPLLTKNFAGIGSRQDNGKMSEDSIQAIIDVYERYLKYNSNIYYTLVKGVNPNLVLAYYDKKDINTKHYVENALKLNYEVVVNYY